MSHNFLIAKQFFDETWRPFDTITLNYHAPVFDETKEECQKYCDKENERSKK